MDENDLMSPTGADPNGTKKKRLVVALVSLAVVVVLAVACALILKEFVFTSYMVDGESMLPTLNGGETGVTDDGDKLFLDMVKTPDRGDIVVFYYDWNASDDPYFAPHHLVKRVIAIAGDRVEIISGTLYINGEAQEEDYILERMDSRADGLSLTVPEGHIFVLGDNRNNSTDSRVIGCVPEENIVGTCFLIASPSGKLRIP